MDIYENHVNKEFAYYPMSPPWIHELSIFAIQSPGLELQPPKGDIPSARSSDFDGSLGLQTIPRLRHQVDGSYKLPEGYELAIIPHDASVVQEVADDVNSGNEDLDIPTQSAVVSSYMSPYANIPCMLPRAHRRDG